MSSTYTGDPTAITTPLSRTVTNATNASPIVITTSAAHQFDTHDNVVISGVGGNTAANGSWTITKLTSTTFSLNGSTGSGAYTSGGTAVDFSLTPQFQIPGDGDNLDAASVNAALETLADRTQYLARGLTLKAATFASSGTWTVPGGCLFAVFIANGAGGGGSGGGGGGGGGTSTGQGHGGAGGGAAERKVQVIATVPGEVATITIGVGGAGGSGGAANNPGVAGSDGGSTTVALTAGTLTWKGGQGGSTWPYGPLTFSAGIGHIPGGNAPAGTTKSKAYVATVASGSQAGFDSTFGAPNPGAGSGGAGHVGAGTVNGTSGNTSVEGFSGGSGGSEGATNDGQGGGGGGGGGGGPNGAGAGGGNGGAGAVGAATGGAGSGGSNATANTGAGGGGGGGGGNSAGGTGGAGASGGAGGSGHVLILYLAAA